MIAYTLEPPLLTVGAARHPWVGTGGAMRSSPSTTGRGAAGASIGSPDNGDRSPPSGMGSWGRVSLWVIRAQVPQAHS
ncbi:hypothetical protein GCM10010425_50240 [Streptomyces spororaveus]|uniref:Uncharacterized protein n=1 Tax=Streptomyces spororaveus TaxID=284039 RepID=A0ABQ3T2J7_9ACTN|nr:hypothetical protein Sspor_01790 [Streptomyces spororaveus]